MRLFMEIRVNITYSSIISKYLSTLVKYELCGICSITFSLLLAEKKENDLFNRVEFTYEMHYDYINI